MKRSRFLPSAVAVALIAGAPAVGTAQQDDYRDQSRAAQSQRDRDGGTIRGRVSEVDQDNNRLTIRTQDGEERTIRVNNQTDITRNNRDIDLDQLDQGDQVSVRTREDGSVARQIQVGQARDRQERQQFERQDRRQGQQQRFGQRDDDRFQTQRDRDQFERRGQQQRFDQRDEQFQTQRGPDRFNRRGQQDWQQERYGQYGQRDEQFRDARDPYAQQQQQQFRDPYAQQQYGQAQRAQRYEQFGQRDEYRQRFERDRETYRQRRQEGETGGLGVALQETRRREGAVVTRVHQGSPADQAGLRSGDLIVVVDDQYIQEPEDVADAITDKRPGERVRLIVERNGREQPVTAQLGSRVEALRSQAQFGPQQQQQFGQYGQPGQPGFPQAYDQRFQQYGQYQQRQQQPGWRGPAMGAPYAQEQRYGQAFRGDQYGAGVDQPQYRDTRDQFRGQYRDTGDQDQYRDTRDQFRDTRDQFRDQRERFDRRGGQPDARYY